jgi:hypothetical protein
VINPKRTNPKRISLIVHFALLAACSIGATESYTTTHGVLVYEGEINAPGRELAEEAVGTTLAFWDDRLGPERVDRALAGVRLILLDDYLIHVGTRPVHGYSVPGASVVGCLPSIPADIARPLVVAGAASCQWLHTRSLIIHELSHQILLAVEGTWDEEEHHGRFETELLGH